VGEKKKLGHGSKALAEDQTGQTGQIMFKTKIIKSLKDKTELAIPGIKKAAAEIGKEAFEKEASKMGGLTPIAVVLLRDHTVDGVFNILGNIIPGGSLVAGAGKMFFRNTIEKLNEALHENGEPYLMNMVSAAWQNKAVTLNTLREGIDKIPEYAVTADVKKEAWQLVNKYYQDAEKQ